MTRVLKGVTPTKRVLLTNEHELIAHDKECRKAIEELNKKIDILISLVNKLVPTEEDIGNL